MVVKITGVSGLAISQDPDFQDSKIQLDEAFKSGRLGDDLRVDDVHVVDPVFVNNNNLVSHEFMSTKYVQRSRSSSYLKVGEVEDETLLDLKI